MEMNFKRILFFITHRTLNEEHAELCFKALSNQIDPVNFDKMYIYNSHQDELPNDKLIQLYEKYELNKIFNECSIFIYDSETPKTLGADIVTIFNYCSGTYNNNDRLFILKSDCLPSKHLLNEIRKTDNIDTFLLTPPFILAKARIENTEIEEYLNRDFYVPSDNITFFNENEDNSKNNDHRNRITEKPTDEHIHFISCTVKTDFSCHYLTMNLFNLFNITSQSWGGCNMSKLRNYWIGTHRSFIIHKYHNIISRNRSQARLGTVEQYLLS